MFVIYFSKNIYDDESYFFLNSSLRPQRSGSFCEIFAKIPFGIYKTLFLLNIYWKVQLNNFLISLKYLKKVQSIFEVDLKDAKEMRNFNNKDNDRSQDQKPGDNMMKRPLTLDLNKKIVNNNNGPPILSTPDVNLCKLGSPELENFILNTDTLQTPTPSAIFPTAKVITYRTPFINNN